MCPASEDGRAHEFAVSAIADAVGKHRPRPRQGDHGRRMSDAVVAALNARIDDLKEQNAALSEMIRDRDRESSPCAPSSSSRPTGRLGWRTGWRA